MHVYLTLPNSDPEYFYVMKRSIEPRVFQKFFRRGPVFWMYFHDLADEFPVLHCEFWVFCSGEGLLQLILLNVVVDDRHDTLSLFISNFGITGGEWTEDGRLLNQHLGGVVGIVDGITLGDKDMPVLPPNKAYKLKP